MNVTLHRDDWQTVLDAIEGIPQFRSAASKIRSAMVGGEWVEIEANRVGVLAIADAVCGSVGECVRLQVFWPRDW